MKRRWLQSLYLTRPDVTFQQQTSLLILNSGVKRLKITINVLQPLSQQSRCCELAVRCLVTAAIRTGSGRFFPAGTKIFLRLIRDRVLEELIMDQAKIRLILLTCF